jgi:serine acetyltransferase
MAGRSGAGGAIVLAWPLHPRRLRPVQWHEIHPGATIGRRKVRHQDHGLVNNGETAEVGDDRTITPGCDPGGTSPSARKVRKAASGSPW